MKLKTRDTVMHERENVCRNVIIGYEPATGNVRLSFLIYKA